MNSKNGKLYLFTAIIIVISLLVVDILSFYLQAIGTFSFLSMTRETLNVTAFVCIYLYIQKTVDPKTLKINDALAIVIKGFIWIAILYSASMLINGSPQFNIDTSLKRKTIQTLVSTTLLSHGMVFMYLQIYTAFQTLIFYKRKRQTAFFYNVFQIIVVLGSLSVVLFDEDLPAIESIGDLGISAIFVACAAICIFVLAVRNSWVTYLNRKEKYVFFFISVMLTVFIDILVIDYVLVSDAANIATHSTFYASLIIYFSHFFAIYTLFSCLYILLHLPTARVFDRKMKEVQYLHNLSTAINSEPDFNKLVLMITNMANEVTESKASWLEIYEEDTDRLYIASSKNLSSMEIKTASMSKNEGLTGKIFFAKKSIVINSIEKNQEFRYLRYWKKDINSIVAVPLITTKNKILGIVYAAKTHEHGFDPDDIAMLEAFSNQIVIALENSKLIQDSIQRERLEQELKIAREVQLKLLPQEIPSIPEVDMDAIAFTANEVGGDYYDFIQKNDDIFSVIVADVSGKGTSAAFYMAELKGIVKSLSTIYHSPKELLLHTNSVLNNHLEKKSFITAGMVYFDLKHSTALHVRAGHCPLIHYSAQTKEVQYLTPKGIGLGLSKAKMFSTVTEEQEIRIQPGDIFVLYTDGLNEARNVLEEEYGDEKIGDIIAENATSTASEIKNAILDDVIAFAGKAKMHDDMTLAVIKILNKE